MAISSETLAHKIRDIPDFPKPGVLFKDITTLLQDGPGFRDAIDLLTERCRFLRPDAIVGMESRGFIFGAPVAYALGVGFVPVRKLGKLPAATITEEYDLEYGSSTVEMHRDAIQPGQRVVIVDDLLATGGTCRATIKLVERLGGIVAGTVFLVELKFLPGRQALSGYQVEAVIAYS
ncbi:MAG: adenine phosphoribosyltransferase [Chloroflexi bacterium]|nr:adenine phosphoribosyltransferase [Chloroflexota bacterium]